MSDNMFTVYFLTIIMSDNIMFIVAVKPTMPPDLSPDQCALPSVNSNFEHEEAVVSGVRFGSHPGSRQEYKELPAKLRIK